MSISLANNSGTSRYPDDTGIRSLQWSEYLYLAAVALAEFLAIDPLRWHVNQFTLLKHLPLLLAVPAVWITICARSLQYGSDRPDTVTQVLKATWPLILLALFIIAGSLYSRLLLGNQTTFLNMGVYLSLVAVGAVMYLESGNPDALLRWYIRILLGGALVMGVFIVHYYGVRQVYHEHIFLVIPLAIWCATGISNRALAWLGAIGILSLGFFSAKNTSYLVALLTGLYIVWQQGAPRLKQLPSITRGFAYYLILLLAVVISSVIGYILLYREQYLPSGNVEYRSHTYQLAWEKFLNSPLWGTAFSDVSVQKFSLYTINIAGGMLQTHSDVMDMLANGGMVAIALWGIGMFMILRQTHRWLTRRDNTKLPWSPHAHTLLGIVAAGIITFTFNPILVDPSLAFMLWSSLGILAGMSIRENAAILPAGRPQSPGRRRYSHSYKRKYP